MAEDKKIKGGRDRDMDRADAELRRAMIEDFDDPNRPVTPLPPRARPAAHPPYADFTGLAEGVKRHGALLILDEVLAAAENTHLAGDERIAALAQAVLLMGRGKHVMDSGADRVQRLRSDPTFEALEALVGRVLAGKVVTMLDVASAVAPSSTKPTSAEVYLTTDEAAKRLNVTSETVRDMIKGRRLRASRTHQGRGGRWRISESDLTEFIRKRRRR